MIPGADHDRQLLGAPMDRLTDRQETVLRAVERYYEVTGEPCPIRYLARRLSRHHSTIQSHLEALERKGWLATRGPAVPIRHR